MPHNGSADHLQTSPASTRSRDSDRSQLTRAAFRVPKGRGSGRRSPLLARPTVCQVQRLVMRRSMDSRPPSPDRGGSASRGSVASNSHQPEALDPRDTRHGCIQLFRVRDLVRDSTFPRIVAQALAKRKQSAHRREDMVMASVCLGCPYPRIRDRSYLQPVATRRSSRPRVVAPRTSSSRRTTFDLPYGRHEAQPAQRPRGLDPASSTLRVNQPQRSELRSPR